MLAWEEGGIRIPRGTWTVPAYASWELTMQQRPRAVYIPDMAGALPESEYAIDVRHRIEDAISTDASDDSRSADGSDGSLSDGSLSEPLGGPPRSGGSHSAGSHA